MKIKGSVPLYSFIIPASRLQWLANLPTLVLDRLSVIRAAYLKICRNSSTQPYVDFGGKDSGFPLFFCFRSLMVTSTYLLPMLWIELWILGSGAVYKGWIDHVIWCCAGVNRSRGGNYSSDDRATFPPTLFLSPAGDRQAGKARYHAYILTWS